MISFAGEIQESPLQMKSFKGTFLTQNTYNTIASHYNWIMEHVDYNAWAEYIGDICKTLKIEPKQILEIGSGTCLFASKNFIRNADFTVFSDFSLPMLRQADPKRAKNKVQCDGTFLPFNENFDFCLMIYDTINHLTEEKDVAKCLQEVYRVLKSGGHFLFDITTEYNSTAYFNDTVDFEENKTISVIRESWYNEKNKTQNNLFTYFIKRDDGSFTRKQESHIQKIYSLENILGLIDASSLSLKASYDSNTFNPPGKNSERIHFLLRK